MTFLWSLIIRSCYYSLIIFYPAYYAHKSIENKKVDTLWLSYFLIMGVLWLMQITILYPVILLLDLASPLIFPIIKMIFVLWLIHPDYKGSLLIEQNLISYLEFAYISAQPYIGNILTGIGVPNRPVLSKEMREEYKKDFPQVNETDSGSQVNEKPKSY